MTIYVGQGSPPASSASTDATQIYASQYGVLANGIIGTTGGITNGSTTFNDTNANFLLGDVGKAIIINGAGTSGQGFATTIAAWISATSVTLATTASTTVTNANYGYGTDDTAAIQTAINTAAAIIATNGKAQVILEDRVHIVAGSLYQTAPYNCQIQLPNLSSGIAALEIRSRRYDIEMSPTLTGNPTVQGCVILSSLGCHSESASLVLAVGVPSVIGGPATLRNGQAFTSLQAIVRGITFLWTHDPLGAGLDLGNCIQAEVTHCRFTTNEPLNAQVVPTRMGAGVIMPRVTNDALCLIDRVEFNGLRYGLVPGEHTQGGHIAAFQCFMGIGIAQNGFGTTGGHACAFRVYDSEHCNIPIGGVDSTWSGTAFNIAPTAKIRIVTWEIETTTGTWATSTHVQDGSNNARIDAVFANYSVAGGVFYPITVTGGSACRLIDGAYGAGAMTTVTLPTSGTASVVQNGSGVQAWRDTIVMVTGGTVTQIQVNGKTTGLTTGPILVPTGQTFSITYSVAPTLTATCL